MLVLFISWLGMLLEAIVLVRGLKVGLVSRFPLFYSYLLVVLVQDLVRIIVYQWYLPLYPDVYWSTQFVSLVMGSLVVFEIYRVALREFPGTARMAKILLSGVFVGVFLKASLTIQAD